MQFSAYGMKRYIPYIFNIHSTVVFSSVAQKEALQCRM